MVNALRRYPDAAAVLRAMIALPEVDAQTRARLQALLAGLN
jgi:hypothetical protein